MTTARETIEGVLDGPRVLEHGESETRWAVTHARARDELAARARLAAHPLVGDAEVTLREGALIFPRLERMELEDAVPGLLEACRDVEHREGTTRALLEELSGPVDAARALGRAGLSRSRVDRFLARTITIALPRGPDLGGLMPGAVWRAGDRPLALSVRHGRALGHPVIDLASLALRAELDTSEAYRRAGGDDDGFALALLHQALRELASERRDEARLALRERIAALVERFLPHEPARVTLSVEAPAFLPRSLFAPLGEVDASHARRVLRDWHGLAVGGETIEVRVTPELARPARTFPFEPARERRARLFSRFAEGIAYDDEGLFSATPEALADALVAGLSGVVIDATAGIGSLTLALARSPAVERVVAIDLDARRLAMAQHNARLYGVEGRIEFRVGDARALVPAIAHDALVIDPPWGGRDYDRQRVTLETLPMDLRPLLAASPRVVLKLPRSFDVRTLPPGFEITAGIDARGVLKMLVARRGVPVPGESAR